MKILVFGGTRFFGKRLVELLLSEGHDVVVATRGNAPLDFPQAVRHVKMDRKNKEDMLKIASEQFDVVYDNICFSSQEAQDSVDAFKGQSIRYVLTSSMAVYDLAGDLKEEYFNPAEHEIEVAPLESFTYAEGKRQAEAVFAQRASFPIAYARIPIVLGIDDYTERLLFHIRQIEEKKEFYLPNPKAEIGFIRSDEAAEFLLQLGTKTEHTGALNGQSNGLYVLEDLLELIKEKTGGEILIQDKDSSANPSPFAIPNDWYLNQNLAKSLGFEFKNLPEWMPELIDELIEKHEI